MSYGNVPGQPQGAGGPGPVGNVGYGSAAPNSYLVWAILTTIFCCQPFGIVSIVFAAQVSSKWNAGDVYGAMDYSSKAKTWALVSTIVGAVWAGIVIIISIIFFASASRSGTTTP